MNPFVNPNTRSITLPAGCKDLIDVLNQKKDLDHAVYRRLIHVILFQAQQDNATELIIEKASSDGETPVRYKVGQVWHEMPAFPSHIRPNVISQLAVMANLPVGQTTGRGAFALTVGNLRVRWDVEITGRDDECRLVCARD